MSTEPDYLHPLLQAAARIENQMREATDTGKLELHVAQAITASDLLALSYGDTVPEDVRARLLAAAVLHAVTRLHGLDLEDFRAQLDEYDGNDAA